MYIAAPHLAVLLLPTIVPCACPLHVSVARVVATRPVLILAKTRHAWLRAALRLAAIIAVGRASLFVRGGVAIIVTTTSASTALNAISVVVPPGAVVWTAGLLIVQGAILRRGTIVSEEATFAVAEALAHARPNAGLKTVFKEAGRTMAAVHEPVMRLRNRNLTNIRRK